MAFSTSKMMLSLEMDSELEEVNSPLWSAPLSFADSLSPKAAIAKESPKLESKQDVKKSKSSYEQTLERYDQLKKSGSVSKERIIKIRKLSAEETAGLEKQIENLIGKRKSGKVSKRLESVIRFKQKKLAGHTLHKFGSKIQAKVRKWFADSRPRVGGQFAKLIYTKEDELLHATTEAASKRKR